MHLITQPKQQIRLSLVPFDNRRLAQLCGECDEYLRRIESRFHVRIDNRGNIFQLIGKPHAVEGARDALTRLYQATGESTELTSDQVHLILQENKSDMEKCNLENANDEPAPMKDITINVKSGAIKGRTQNQKIYLHHIFQHDITFGIGPAGTGKTYLAVAAAVHALEKNQVRKIILVRPVVEAGENLGFLPGDLTQKLDPYLRPLYDALGEMLGTEKLSKLIQVGIIEIAPLAYMRGRTLSDAFIILDESQNCTKEQMRMFLTRIGFGSRAVITGDITQIDLPKGKLSGLKHAIEVLSAIKPISFNYFMGSDVVRHPLIEAIVDAYNVADAKTENHQ